ncbi:MAG: AMP-binding protein, partial [Beijerinckiaceae bacterium]
MTAAAADADTFPKLIARNARTRGERPAFRLKDLGIWQQWTWAEVHETTRAFALGLAKLGLAPGDKVAIIGVNRPRLYMAMAAAQSLGAVPVPVYSDSVADEMAYVLEHAEAVMAVVQDQEQVDKILSVAERTPRLKHALYDETRGLRDYDHTHLHPIDKVIADGQAVAQKDSAAVARLDASIAGGKGSDLSVILYTSGTTGRPKGVMLTFDNLIAGSVIGIEFDGLKDTDEIIAYLPMAWVGDHVFSYTQAIIAGYCVNCPEGADTVVDDRREIGTTYAFAPPRVFETMLTLTMVRMEDAGRVKRAMFDYFIGVAKKYGEKILNKEPVPLQGRLLYALGDFFVYAPLRNRFG